MSVSTSEARERFSEILKRASEHKERVVLTDQGKELAALVPIEDLELIEEMIDLKEACAALEEEGGIPLEKLAEELGV